MGRDRLKPMMRHARIGAEQGIMLDGMPQDTFTFSTPSSVRRGEYVGIAVFTLMFWIVAAMVSIVAYAFLDIWTKYRSAMPGAVGVMIIAAVLCAWVYWLAQRLVFSITLGPDGVGFGKRPRKRIPYRMIDLIRLSPANPVNRRNAHWLEVRAGTVRRRLFLDGMESECGRILFERSVHAVLIDESGDEHLHPDSPRPIHSIRILLAHRRRRGKALVAVSLILLVIALLLLAEMLGLPGGGVMVRGMRVRDAVILLLGSLAFLGAGLGEFRKAAKARAALDDLSERGVEEAE